MSETETFLTKTFDGFRRLFVRYKILFIIYGIAVFFAVWEIYRVPTQNKDMISENYLNHLTKFIDSEDSFYHFQMEKYDGRPEAEYLKGMKAFKSYKSIADKQVALRKEDKPEEADSYNDEARAKLVEAREYFENALDQGIISNENLMIFHVVTLKLLGVPEEEYEKAFNRMLINFPEMNLPPFLEGDLPPSSNMANHYE